MTRPVLPFVFGTSTLGRSVLLGELYDQHSEKFLGVQLFPQDKIKSHEIDLGHTDLILGHSNTYQQKAALLDVSPLCALQALCGLVRAAGSGTYINDKSVNSNGSVFTLILKRRHSEKRLLFTEPEMSKNVLKVAVEDYVTTEKATHFVSSIVYGANVAVSLCARQSELSGEEKVDGYVQEELERLRGAVDLKGNADEKVKQQFANLDGKFDLVIHSDIPLEKIPRDPKDLLDTFPAAVAGLAGSRELAIRVTLQPIPLCLSSGICVYPLDSALVDLFLQAFSNLNILRGGFSSVLQDGAKRLQALIPELARTIHVVAVVYNTRHAELLGELATFLLEDQHGNNPGFARMAGKATELYRLHVDQEQRDPDISARYPSSLAGLDHELLMFQNFILSLKRQGESLQIAENVFRLSSIEEVVRATEIHQKIPLFIATPFPCGEMNPNNIIRKYFALIRKHAELFSNTDEPPYLFYAEDLVDLERRLPNHGRFATLEDPALFVGKVDDRGELTWDLVSE